MLEEKIAELTAGIKELVAEIAELRRTVADCQILPPAPEVERELNAPREHEPVEEHTDPLSVTLEELKARASDAARILGPDAPRIVEILNSLGSDRLSTLDPGKYNEFAARLGRLVEDAR